MSVVQPRPIDKITMAAARLKAAAPNTFAEMLDAFHALYATRSGECVQAQPDAVLKAQGKALQVQELLNTLSTCTEDAHALDQKLRAKEKT